MPRISVQVTSELAEFLENYAASEKRSVSAQAAMIIEQSGHFIGWKEMKKRLPEIERLVAKREAVK